MTKKVKDIIQEGLNVKSVMNNQVKETLTESVKNAFREIMENSIIKEDDEVNTEEEVIDDEGVDINDTNTEETPEIDIETSTEDDVDMGIDNLDTEIDNIDSEGDEWDEFENLRISDNGDYDLTGVDNETLAKVYKLLKNDDKIIINQTNDSIEINDSETGGEYFIKLDNENSVEEGCKINETEEVPVGFEDKEFDVTSDDDIKDDGLNGDDDLMRELELLLGDDNSIEETIDMGNEEPLEELTTVTSSNARKVSKTHTSNNRQVPQGSRNISTAEKGYIPQINEALDKAIDVVKENKKLKTQLKQYRNDLIKAEKVLKESLNTNTNLYNIVKLLSENTVKRNEKIDIIKRFSGDIKNIDESNKLYESIKKELNSEKPNKKVINENIKVENPKPNLIESNSIELNHIRNLMEKLDRK